MTTTLFTDGWTFYRGSEVAGTPVRLPHDAMIGEPRTAEGGTGNHGGFFPGGLYAYRKRWTAPESADELSYRLMFEGVYGATTVKVNGREVGRNNSPYREFHVALEGIAPGDTALIEVEVDNRATPNSRWYTGSGIYRPVWLETVGSAAIAPHGVHIITRALRPVAARLD